MLFDPFTMIAQLINFVVLVVALRHFLYKPVIDAMDERENKIAQRLTDADEREHEAEAAAESYRRRQVEIDDRRDELLENAGHDAAERRTELIEQAREDVEDRRNRWLQGLRREREDLDRELQRRVGAEVLVVGRRALVALADADIERRALDKALDHLEADEPALRPVWHAGGPGPARYRDGSPRVSRSGGSPTSHRQVARAGPGRAAGRRV